MRVGLLAALLLFAWPAAAEVITGPAAAIDGDTIRIGDERIRLIGIDAPELHQSCRFADGSTWPCGNIAGIVLRLLIGDGEVTCNWSTRDQYDRALATCMTVTGVDLNRHMVRAGYAWAYLSDTYLEEEAAARAGGNGVWQAPTETAADYRRARQAAIIAGQPLPPDDVCIIKGNISRSGDRIYHTPDMPSYAGTVIRIEDGERWFCTEAEAIEAGWRRPLD